MEDPYQGRVTVEGNFDYLKLDSREKYSPKKPLTNKKPIKLLNLIG